MRWSRILALLGVMTVGGSIVTATAQSETEQPGSVTGAEPTQVLSGAFAWVAVALDPRGDRHLVASTDVAGFEAGGDLWYATDRSGSWVTERLLEGRGCEGSWVGPDIAVDADGSVHLVAALSLPCDTPSGSRGIYHLTDRDRDPGDFGPTIRATRRGVEWPSVAVSDGAVSIASARVDAPRQPRTVFLSSDRTGAWTSERVADDGFRPSHQLDADGRAHVVFGDRRGLRHAEQVTAGGQVSQPRRIPSTDDATSAAELDLDAEGRPAIVWVSRVGTDDALHWLPSTASGWGSREQLRLATDAALAFDSAGRPHVAAATSRESAGEVVHGVLDDGAWTWSTLATADSLVRVAIDAMGSAVTVAWAARPDGDGGVWVTEVGDSLSS